MAEKHIFVVEDEIHTQLAINVILKSAGYRVTICSSCAEALNILSDKDKAINPDLLVTDICTPVMSGIELIAELKKKGINIPTLVITGFREQHTAQVLQEGGCEHFLYKPFSDDEILDKVKLVLNISK